MGNYERILKSETNISFDGHCERMGDRMLPNIEKAWCRFEEEIKYVIDDSLSML